MRFKEGESRGFSVSNSLGLCIFDQHEHSDCFALDQDYQNDIDDNEIFTIAYLNSTFILVNRTRASSATEVPWRVHNGTLLFATEGHCSDDEADTVASWEHIELLEADSCAISSSTDPGPSSTPTTFTISSSTTMPSPTGSMPSPSASMDATRDHERCKGN